MQQKKRSRTHKKHNKRESRSRKVSGPLRKEDISELVLGPLSDQIDHARIQILERIGEVNDSTDILGRQKKRDIDAESKKGATSQDSSLSSDSAVPRKSSG